MLAGWEGSAHDALILADAIERDDGLRVPPGTCNLIQQLHLHIGPVTNCCLPN